VKVSKILAKICHEDIGGKGFVGRDSGEEILIAIPGIDEDALLEVTRKINGSLNTIDREFTNEKPEPKDDFYKKTTDPLQREKLSASMGYGVCENKVLVNKNNLDGFISALDAACLDAKRQGRNRAVRVQFEPQDE
jgi:GGDEF domain-containing protein